MIKTWFFKTGLWHYCSWLKLLAWFIVNQKPFIFIFSFFRHKIFPKFIEEKYLQAIDPTTKDWFFFLQVNSYWRICFDSSRSWNEFSNQKYNYKIIDEMKGTFSFFLDWFLASWFEVGHVKKSKKKKLFELSGSTSCAQKKKKSHFAKYSM